MRGLSGVDLRRVHEHVAFMANRKLLSYSIAIIIANIISALFLIFFFYTGPASSIWSSIPLGFSIFIYKILISIQASRVGRELNTGEVQIYLAHTLTRTEYLLSALLVVGITPALVLVATYLTFLAIAAPLSYDVGSQLPYLFAELMMHATIVMALAIGGHENAASIVGVMLALFIGAIMGIPLFLLILFGSNKPAFYVAYAATLLVAMATPLTYRFTYSTIISSPLHSPATLPDPLLVLLLSTAAFIILWMVFFIRFKRRDL